MSIKKAYVELVDFLNANEGKKVSTLLPQILEMVESKKQNSTYIKDKDGNVVAIFCYYHKQWEVVGNPDKVENAVEFGSKANSATKLNSMCKVGTSLWTKAQRDAKKANADLLTLVAKGDVEPSGIVDEQVIIEKARITMNVTNMPKGYASEEEVLIAIN